MSWLGHLKLDYRLDGQRTIAHDLHHGPLRVLQRLYPEGDAVCHHVLVHPPGGVAGGDVLDIDINMAPGSHALITTPGATRFYRSGGELARQSLVASLSEGARLEWLPLETIAYRGCRAENRTRFELGPGAEMIGWDLLALGLPAAGELFDDPAHPGAYYTQCIELPGIWLERGTVRSDDQRLLDSPLGWAGHRVMGTLWFAAGLPLAPNRRNALLETARAVVDGHALESQAGCTSPHAEVVVLRVLGARVEPVMQLLSAVWAHWREAAWQKAPCPPRVWRT